jgi:hypothetical protein
VTDPLEYTLHILTGDLDRVEWVPMLRVRHDNPVTRVEKAHLRAFPTHALEKMTLRLADDIAQDAARLVSNCLPLERKASVLTGTASDPLEYLVVRAGTYRWAMTFYVFQRSAATGKVRLLVYGIDYTFHKGGGFATNLGLIAQSGVGKIFGDASAVFKAPAKVTLGGDVQASPELLRAIEQGTFEFFVPPLC